MEKILIPEKQKRAEEPKFRYRIFLTYHGTEKDMIELKEQFKQKPDVYIPEFHAWNDSVARAYRMVSAGTLMPEKAMQKLKITKNNTSYSSILMTLKTLYKSSIPVAFVDYSYPEQEKQIISDLFHKFISYEKIIESAFKESKKPSRIARELRKWHEKEIELNTKREKFIEEQLKPDNLKLILENMVRDYEQDFSREKQEGFSELFQNLNRLQKKLNKNSEITALISLGISHSPLLHRLKKSGADAQWISRAGIIGKDALTFSINVMSSRYIQFKKKKITEEFFLREFLEAIFLALYFEKFKGKSSSEQIKVVRDAILRIPEQKLRDTIKELQRTYSRSPAQFKESLEKYSDKILFFKKA